MASGRVSFEDDEDLPAAHPQQSQHEAADYFSVSGSDGGDGSTTTGSIGSESRLQRTTSLAIQIPPNEVQTSLAFTALQYLPMPVLVLSSSKTVVLANEAMGRLLGIELTVDDENTDPNDIESRGPYRWSTRSCTDILYGVGFGQLGLDLLQNGSAVFVAWENFLDTVVDDAARSQSSSTCLNSFHYKRQEEDETPTGEPGRKRSTSMGSKLGHTSGAKTQVHDAVVDVVFSTNRDPITGLPLASKSIDANAHVEARMIISVWATEDEQYFTLTFTSGSSQEVSPPISEAAKTTSRTVSRTPTSYTHSTLSSGMSSASSSGSVKQRHHGLKGSTPNSGLTSPTTMVPQFKGRSALRGPPPKTTTAAAPTMFSKTNRLKDAILNSMSFPAYALWKDESFGLPNKAAIKLLYPWIEDDGMFDTSEHARDFLGKYSLYNEDFTEKLAMDNFPIYKLMREQQRFEGYRIGMYSAKDSSRILFDTIGEPIRDDKGEFLGGLVIFQDITSYATTINEQRKQNERQFEDITNMIPQMIWRTTPTGMHDFYSQQWYDYTGLTHAQCEGEGWVNAFHPDDLAVAEPHWMHSLATGDEYRVEYRCKRADGEWRWMLGRAHPMRDANGDIVKWFGTCTDIHEQVIAREEAQQTRAQLKRVIEHAQITLWAVDKDRRLTLFEGKPMYSEEDEPAEEQREHFLGMNIYDIFKEQGRQKEEQYYAKPIEQILAGTSVDETTEVAITQSGKWYRTRLTPLMRTERRGAEEGASYVDGVVGISMDITPIKVAAAEIQEKNKENSRLMAQSLAAKEASKMKSQFLANMSHEIRTPIAGVIGMSELLLDDDSGVLTAEQRECAENIQRSANGLLTVINDILDFSKVESGRLDIEEVQFDLSVVIRDVNKMLSFAAERKGLKYIDDIQELRSWKVMGDPGRLRQVITNLLTNSIKFTSEGSVTMRVHARKETDDMIEVHFTVEDTGIGIEEEVRKKLFKPFSQADSSTARRFGGTGLGLTISKNLVALMHGEIKLESRLGVGTKATFWIPFNKAPYQSSQSSVLSMGAIPDRLQSDLSVSRASSEHSGPATPTTPGKPMHFRNPPAVGSAPMSLWSDDHVTELPEAERQQTQVLVVEDNPINQQIALKTIRKLGFPVRAVWNGQEALDYLHAPSETQPKPDIILMDVQMPICDGYVATYTIRNSFADTPEVRNVPIVAMTASAIQGDREKCQRAGMDDYLAKPVKKPNLEKMLVKWAVEGRRKKAELMKNHNQHPGGRPIFRAPPSTQSASSHSLDLEEHLSSELDRLEFAHRAAFEQSAESTGDRAERQQMAEEKAISLRDDQLIESGDDPKHKLGRNVSDVSADKWYESNQDSMLTAENMQRLDGTQKGPVRRLIRDDSNDKDDASSSIAATVGETVVESVANAGENGIGPVRTGAPSPLPGRRPV